MWTCTCASIVFTIDISSDHSLVWFVTSFSGPWTNYNHDPRFPLSAITMTVGVSNQLIVPITLWGNEPPTHCISCIFVTPDQKTIVTGCNDGHICLWSVDKKDGKWDPSSITPRCMLFGHSAPVMCLTNAISTFESSILVSSSEAGLVVLGSLF